MSWLGRAIGEFGSQGGIAHDIGLDWRQREQQMRLNALKEMADRIMLPLQMKELTERIRQMNSPQFKGFVGTPGGGTAAATFSPSTGAVQTQGVVPGIDKAAAKAQVLDWANAVPPTYRGFFQSAADAIDRGQDPLEVLKAAEQYASQIGFRAVGRGTAKVLGTIPYGVSDPVADVDYYADEQGRLHAPSGGPAPKELQDLYSSAYAAYQKRLQDQYDMVAKREGFAQAQQARQFAEQERKLALKAGQDAVIAQERLADSLDAAKTHSNPGDLIIVENFMQLAFGQQPRGIRGSPAWFEQMRKMSGGSLGQRFEGYLASLQGGGLLGDDARADLLGKIKMLVKNRVQAGITMAGAYSKGTGVPAMPEIDLEEGSGKTPPPPPPGFTLESPH